MVTITTAPGMLIMEVDGLHKLWALKSRLEIPLDHVRGVRADPHPAMGWFDGLKVLGTDVPNHFRAGLFWQDGDRVFWDVRHPERTIVLDLEADRYAKLIIEVEDPEAAIRQIDEALKVHRSSRTAAEQEVTDLLSGCGSGDAVAQPSFVTPAEDGPTRVDARPPTC